MADNLIYGYRVFIDSRQKYYSVVGIRRNRNNSILTGSTLIVTLNGNEFFTCSFNMQKAELGNHYLPDSLDYFPFESSPVKSLGEKILFTYKINNTFNFDEFQKYSNIFYKYSLNGNIFRIEKHNTKVLDVDVYPISNQIISNNCTIIPSTSDDIESPLTLIKIRGDVNVLRKIEALEVSSAGVVKNVLNIANADNSVSIPCNLVTGQHIIFIPEDVVNNVDYQVLYYNVIAQQQQLDPEPEQIDTELEITSYPDYNDTNVNNSVGFNGLVKYFTNNIELTTAQLSSNVYLNGVGSNTVFVNSGIVDAIKIYPQLRTKVEYNDGSQAVVVYENSERPISVTITNVINHDNEISTKYENIPYNQPYILPLGGAKQIVTTIHFKVDENTELEKTIQFFYLPSILYTRLVTNNLYEFDSNEYTALIDWTTGESADVSKWGCLLLTNEFEEIWDVEVNGETKKAAELVPTTKVRLGNLNGIYNETFGVNQPKGFGLYGESVYLTGNFYLNNGKSLVDIDNDLLLANGNIERIRQTLANLDNSLHNSIYNLTLETAGNYANSLAAIEAAKAALTSDFNTAIATNSEAVFKLSKDYALWAVGNAGIAIINPNVAYNEEDGSIDDSTVGDGDEYLLLQGDSVQIATNKTENGNIKVVCTTVNPTGFKYSNDNLFNPKDGNDNNVIFKIGWITPAALSRVTKHKVEISSGDKLFRYVALNKADGTGDGHQWGNRTFYTNPPLQDTCNVYSFTSYLTLDSQDSIYIKSDGQAVNGSTTLSGNYYIIPDVVIAGMFENGKFNASLIEVENIVAVGGGTKNPNFDVNSIINSGNYPTTNTINPFVVISGTTGKITAQGVDLKEAVIGGTRVSGNNIVVGKNDITGEHIRIVDNYGIQVTPDYFNNSSMNASVKDTKPAIYFRNGEEVISKISSDKDTTLEKFFKNSKTTNLVTNVSKTLFNNTSITYNRQLTVASGSIGGPSNKTIIGTDGYYYFKVDKSELSYSSSGDFYGVSMIGIVYSQPVYRKIGNNTFTQISDNGHISTSQYSTYNEFYYRSNIECDSFLPTRTKLRVKTRSTAYNYVTSLPYCQLYNSDIQKVEYSTNSVTSSNIALSSNNITLSSDNNASYEISGSLKAKLHNSIKLKHLSATKAENSAVITHSNNLSNGFVKYIDGQLCITLNVILRNVNDSNDYIILKTVKYFTKCTSKTTSANGVDITTYYPDGVTTYDEASTAENDISNPNVDSIDCNVYEFISNSENNFNDNVIRFSKFIKGDNKTYSLRLLASVDFNQTGRIGDYKFNKQYSNNDNLGPNAYDLPADPNIINQMGASFDEHGSSSAISFGTPRDNGYEWHPLLCPKQYTVYPQIDVTNCTINKTLISEKTIIQGNGFLTGYSNQNQFTVSFVEDGDNIIFKKQEFIKGVGNVLSNNGFFNAFYVNNTLKQIPQPIPILYGSLYPSSRYETVRTSKKYEYYSFSGYSLISGTQDNFGGNNDDVFLLNNIFQQIRSYTKSIHGRYSENPIIYGNVHYMKNYDLYLISEEGQCGKVVLLFGSQWDQLFVQYGTSLFINVIPKFRNYGSSSTATLIIDDDNKTAPPSIVTSYQKEPIIVDISQTLKDVNFQYQKITGINNNIYTFATQNPIECTSMYGYEFDCYSAWPIVYQSNLDNKYYGALNIVPGYFDIVVNYIPNLSN